MTVEEFIKNSWGGCVIFNPEDDGTLIGMPYHYIVPVEKEHWNEMYYWDTFFTCKGLALQGREELVKNCADNMLYMVEKYGFMPNANRTYYLNRSQPPFLSMLVRDVYNLFPDKEWLSNAYGTLKKEYDFWMTQRMTPTGLNKFGVQQESIEFVKEQKYERVCRRLKKSFPHEDAYDIAANFLCDCESGWDFNPRTDMKQTQFVYVDLNSNLYLYETNFAYFAEVLENGETELWKAAAEKRKELMNKVLWKNGAFLDYNFVENKHSDIFSVASFYPLWAGVATKKQAEETVVQLNKVEFEYGVAACCENYPEVSYQWNFPVGWPPLQYIMVRALDNYGYKTEAKRIAQKYVDIMEKFYNETGSLWEKYDVTTGSHEVTAEYASRVMLGWSAGVYLYCRKYLADNK